MDENRFISVNELKPNEKAIIRGFKEGVEESNVLREMGLIEGTSVEMIKSAPFGDPLEIRVRGFHLSIRRSQAKTILVEKTENQAGYASR